MEQNPLNGRTSKVRSYFFYAIGEIALVMIGILLALQVNNWNEIRKEQLRSEEYHQRIAEDLDRLVQLSSYREKQSYEILKHIISTLNILDKGSINSPQAKDTLDYALLWFTRSTYQLPDMQTYDEMKSAGELSLIYDVELRNKLAEFRSYLIQVEAVYDRLSEAIENDYRIFNRYLRSEVDEENLEVSHEYDFEAMSKDKELINTLSRISVHWRGFTYFMDRVHRSGLQLQSQLNNYKSK